MARSAPSGQKKGREASLRKWLSVSHECCLARRWCRGHGEGEWGKMRISDNLASPGLEIAPSS